MCKKLNPNQLSKTLNVTPQAVYKKLKQFNNELLNHVERSEKGKILLDAYAQDFIKNSFEPVQQLNEIVQQPVVERFNNQTNDEITFLRARIEALENQIITKDKLIDNLTDLLSQAHTLVAMNKPKALTDGEPSQRRGFLDWFRSRWRN